MSISVPAGFFSSSSDDQEAAERRKQIRDTLLKEGEVKVNRNGMVSQPTSGNSSQPTIIIPPGKLASFYWYECNPELLESEKIAMAKFFPQFTLDRLNDGRLVWHGKLDPENGVRVH